MFLQEKKLCGSWWSDAALGPVDWHYMIVCQFAKIHLQGNLNQKQN